MPDLVETLTTMRATRPEAVLNALASRRRRPLWTAPGRRLFLIAADHPARGSLRVGANPAALADRGELLRRLVIALDRPGVDGVLGTADVLEDLALLGALDGKLAFGSMNRAGIRGSVFELDDRFACYDGAGIERAHLDGGKMLLRIARDDMGTLSTLTGCARAIDELAARRLPAMLEVFVSAREGGEVRNLEDPALMAWAIGIGQALGSSSAYTWLKLPVFERMEEVLKATTLPTFLLGGDPGDDGGRTFRRWERAMSLPQVRGLVVGRTMLYPAHGDVSEAVDAAAALVGNV